MTAAMSGTMTMRRALEQSKNLVTARLLDGGIDRDAEAKASTRSARLAVEGAASIRNASATIRSCSAPSRCGRSTLPAFYAAIANEGRRPTPHVIEQITQDGRDVYKADEWLKQLARRRSGGGVPASHHPAGRGGARHRGAAQRAVQLRRRQDRHQRRVQRLPGSSASAATSRSRSGSATTTPEGKRTLGHGQAGRKVALPIFEPIMKAVWARLRAADAAAAARRPRPARQLVALPIDVHSGQRIDSRGDRTAFDRILPAGPTAAGCDESHGIVWSRAATTMRSASTITQDRLISSAAVLLRAWFSRIRRLAASCYRQREQMASAG